MRKLKCSDCGGAVRIVNSPDQHVIGRCESCGSEYVLQLKGRSHVIVEHRFPDGMQRRGLSERSSNWIAITIVAISLVCAALALIPEFSQEAAPAARDFEVIYDVGGEGAGPGQFRDYIHGLGVDNLDRVLAVDTDNRFYVFGPEGNFLTQYIAPPEAEDASYLAVLPRGEVVLTSNKTFHFIDLATGKYLRSLPRKEPWVHGQKRAAVTPDGGLAYYQTENKRDGDQDVLIFYGPDFQEKRRLTGLLAKALANDPMVKDPPVVGALAIAGSGNIYLDVRAREKMDARGGIYEFNGDGVFLRRIAVDQGINEELLVTGKGDIWYRDSWSSALQYVTASGVKSYYPQGKNSMVNLWAFAIFTNDELVVATAQSRLIRLRLTADLP